jgi:hypothetical protein
VKVAGNLQLFDSGDTTTQRLQFGNARDLSIHHDGSNSYLVHGGTGNLIIQTGTNDGDILFKSDDGSGGVTAYITLDGSETNVDIAVDTTLAATKKLYFDGGSHTYIHESANDQLDFYVGAQHMLRMYEGGTDIVHTNDNVILGVGNDPDLELKHDGTDSFISNDAGDLYIESRTTDKDIIFRSGSTAYLTLDGSAGYMTAQKELRFADGVSVQVGNSGDATFFHTSGNTTLQNGTGNFTIQNLTDDGDLILKCDDGSGGTTAYITLDGSASRVVVGAVDLSIPVAKKLYFGGGDHTYISEDADDRLRFFVGGDEFMRFTQQDAGGEIFGIYQDVYIPDAKKMHFGGGNDLILYHDGSNSSIENHTGGLFIDQNTNNGDITFRNDDGSGGVTSYLIIDGNAERIQFSKKALIDDNVKFEFGSGADLQVYHNGTNSYINNTTGDLHISQSASDKDIRFSVNDGGSVKDFMYMDSSNMTLQMLNSTISGVNLLQFNDPGAGEGISWIGASWSVFVSGDDMSNTAGNLQFVSGSAGAGRTNGHIAMRGHSEATLSSKVKTQLYMPSSSLEIGNASAAGANVANDARVNIVSEGNERTLKLRANNDGTNGARSVSMEFQGYEGRAAGAYYYDINYTGHEWFVGTPYAANHQRFMIGYDDGGLSEYQASASIMIHPNSKVEIGTSTTNYDLQVYGSLTTEGPDGGAFVGSWAASSDFAVFGTANMAGGEYALLTDGTNTFVGAGNSGKTFFRGPANDDTPQLVNDGTNIYLENAGNFGIGVTSPGALLDVGGDADEFALIGRARVGYNSHSDYASFQHRDSATTGGYALLQQNNGATYLNAASGRPIYFRINNSDAMHINSSGYVGIGTTSPGAKFTVRKDGTQAASVSTTYQIQTVSNSNGGIAIQAGDSSHAYLVFGDNGDYDAGRIGYENANHNLKFFTNNAEKVRIESDGDLHADGDVIAASTTVSDKRLKDNVEIIPNALDKIKELRGVSFDWNKGGRKGQRDIGLIAQEVEKVLPELVREKKMALIDDKEYLTVDYDKMVAVLVEAVKEQQVQIEELKEDIKELKK